MRMRVPLSLALVVLSAHSILAQVDTTKRPKPEDTEVWTPVPKIIAPGATERDAPSDAIALFNGSSAAEWVQAKDSSPAKWTVANGMLTVNKAAGDIQTKRSFTNFQLHVEWRIPPNVIGSGQARGNSGVFLAYAPPNGYYELQILDSYENTTYVNGQAGSIYKQFAPLVNAMRKPGEWQVYDVIWTAPTFNGDGTLKTPAYVTAFHNGVVIQNHVALNGNTEYIGLPKYHKHGAAPILLQAHGDPSPAISFRNIWVREIP
jgi:3-keto-disaccharide hydrolase